MVGVEVEVREGVTYLLIVFRDVEACCAGDPNLYAMGPEGEAADTKNLSIKVSEGLLLFCRNRLNI